VRVATAIVLVTVAAAARADRIAAAGEVEVPYLDCPC